MDHVVLTTGRGVLNAVVPGSAAVVLFWCSLRTWCFSNLDALGTSPPTFLRAPYALSVTGRRRVLAITSGARY
eukprot:524437-Rhodomonas_salina.3